MDRKELESALEAILFASGEPVQVDRICVALDIDPVSYTHLDVYKRQKGKR